MWLVSIRQIVGRPVHARARERGRRLFWRTGSTSPGHALVGKCSKQARKNKTGAKGAGFY
jgi:hypothetical protein